MGFLKEGKWVDDDLSGLLKEGRLARPPTQFRNKITKDGSSGFPAVPGRYRLYVSYACPWAHRTLITRTLKQLEAAIPILIVSPLMLKQGWTFEDFPGSTPDTANGFHYLHQVYTTTMSDYTGRVSVPVLWDTVTRQIVNNESAEIILMMNEAFDLQGTPDLYPEALREEIEAVNGEVYDKVNNGVYKTGLARVQDGHEESARALFQCLDWLEERLGRQKYLVGDTFTSADIRLFTTLVRFDPVYFVHFKCSLRLLSSYHNLSNYLRDIYQMPGVAATVNMDHIKTHYYRSHLAINPFGLVPIGPVPDLTLPHDRNRLPERQISRKLPENSKQGFILVVAETLITTLLASLSL